MNAKDKLFQVQLQEWTARFEDQQKSNLSVRQWCELNNISYHAYNYWKHKLKEQVVDHMLPDIVPVTFPEPVAAPPDIAVPITNTVYPSTDAVPLRANRAICTNNTNPDSVAFRLNDFSLEIDASIPESFLIKLLKAVKHAERC